MNHNHDDRYGSKGRVEFLSWMLTAVTVCQAIICHTQNKIIQDLNLRIASLEARTPRAEKDR